MEEAKQNLQTQVEKVKAQLLKLVEISPENNWEVYQDKDDCIVHTRKDEQGFQMSRGRAIIKATKEEFTEFVTNLANRSKYVDNYKDGSVIEKINDNLFVCWVKYKAFFPMDDRDTVYVVGIFREDNRIIIA